MELDGLLKFLLQAFTALTEAVFNELEFYYYYVRHSVSLAQDTAASILKHQNIIDVAQA